MNNLSPRERLLRTLSRQPVDRPPVLCTGGMMNAAISAIVATTANTLPTAHSDPERMTELAVAVQQATGFENLGAPFCLTVEAEALGSLVDLGTATRDPTLTHEVFPNLAAVCLPPVEVLLERGRVSVFLAATARLARQYPTLPVLANLIGPTSTAAALVAPLAFIKGLCKERERAHQVVTSVTRFLCGMATRLIEHGADVIVIHDDTATPTLLGPELFWAFTAPYLAMLIAHIQGRGMPVIVHLCGDLTSILPWLVKLGANALSVDAATSVRAAKAAVPELPIMGNLSTVKLHLSDPDSIAARARQLLAEGVDILGPGCGLSRDTPLVNIQALTRTRGREPGATSESAT